MTPASSSTPSWHSQPLHNKQKPTSGTSTIHRNADLLNGSSKKKSSSFLKGILFVILGFVLVPILYLQIWLSGTFVPYHHYYSSHPTQQHHQQQHDERNNNPVHATLQDFRRSRKNYLSKKMTERRASGSVKKRKDVIDNSLPSPKLTKSITRKKGKSVVENTLSTSSTSSSLTDNNPNNIANAGSTSKQSNVDEQRNTKVRVLTAYLESPSTLTHIVNKKGSGGILAVRNTTSSTLLKREFPTIDPTCRYDESTMDTSAMFPSNGHVMPIDDYPIDDPYLPWIHDYFVSDDVQSVKFIAQNHRRCDTGPDHVDTMAYWEPQIALFQPIPIITDDKSQDNMIDETTTSSSSASASTYRIATSVENATYPATRFQCEFCNTETNECTITFSRYMFDYEYVSWRKSSKSSLSSVRMFDRNGGKDTAMFWLSTLLFECPIPRDFQPLLLLKPSSEQEEQTRSILSTDDITEKNNRSNNRSIKAITPNVYLDLIPIRTPARQDGVLLTKDHVGPELYTTLQHFDLEQQYGSNHILPSTKDAGRWSNIPLCPRKSSVAQPATVSSDDPNQHIIVDKSEELPPQPPISQSKKEKPYQFVACTWTAASYTRRGDAVRLSDSAARLREWIIFHLMVGVEHIYIYDNTDPSSNNTELWQVAEEFSSSGQVTYHPWPCKVCNNNRPAHSNPGERSSQYAAEASCRERYGPSSEWMTFLDPDEYLIPMKKMKIKPRDGRDDEDQTARNLDQKDKLESDTESAKYDWRPILDEMLSKNISIIEFRSSRAKPRRELMTEVEDQSVCVDPVNQKNDRFPNTDLCIAPKSEETFLHVYNCEFIRSPKPTRFERARKQIYRPSYVYNHFVHYSTVTAKTAETYKSFQERIQRESGRDVYAKSPTLRRNTAEIFSDEINTGVLVHSRSVLAHETRRLSKECHLNSKVACMVGHLCEDSVQFDDSKHKDNVFHNPDGSFCNCWKNDVIEFDLVPQLEGRIKLHQRQTIEPDQT